MFIDYIGSNGTQLYTACDTTFLSSLTLLKKQISDSIYCRLCRKLPRRREVLIIFVCYQHEADVPLIRYVKCVFDNNCCLCQTSLTSITSSYVRI